MQDQILNKMIEIRAQYGEAVFLEPKRLLAFIKDYYPNAKHEHQLLNISIPLHLYETLKKVNPSCYSSIREEKIEFLKQQYLVPHQWAQEAIDLWIHFMQKNIEEKPLSQADERLEGQNHQADEDHALPLIGQNLQAMMHKANCYYYGDGIQENREEALRWYEKAALLGSVEAMNYVGNMYYMGDGIPKNEALAHKWYEKAAYLGSSKAMNYLGNMYCEGRGVTLDFAQACKWYSQSVARGNYTALFNLGYVNCEAFLRKEVGSFEEVLKRAQQGEIQAMYYVAYCYHWGESVEINYKDARKWYETLANMGEQTAMIWLAYMYFNGQGVEKSTELARQWCEKAIKI